MGSQQMLARQDHVFLHYVGMHLQDNTNSLPFKALVQLTVVLPAKVSLSQRFDKPLQQPHNTGMKESSRKPACGMLECWLRNNVGRHEILSVLPVHRILICSGRQFPKDSSTLQKGAISLALWPLPLLFSSSHLPTEASPLMGATVQRRDLLGHPAQLKSVGPSGLGGEPLPSEHLPACSLQISLRCRQQPPLSSESLRQSS